MASLRSRDNAPRASDDKVGTAETAMGDFGGALTADSLAAKAFDRLIEAIEKGEIALGSRIREAPLARQLGISRGPLREALRRLEGRKLVEHSPNLGVRIIGLSLSDVIEIFQMREVLEGAACRLAAERMSNRELDELAKLLEKHQTQITKQRGEAYFQRAGDLDFHFRIAQGSGNRRLVQMLCDELYYLVRIHRYRSSFRPGRSFKALEEHHAIVEAMRNRDPARAEELMRAHIGGATRGLTEEFKTQQESA
jgi:DNA-binding GntR family transcriptional regulator